VRKLIYGFLGVLTLAVAAVVILLLTLDLNGYKPEIEAELEAATGRDVVIGGDIHFTVLPALALAVDDLRIAGLAEGSGEPLLSLPRAQAVVALLPLFSGEVQIERIRLVDPMVVLERGADGRGSWEFATAGDGQPGAMSVSIDSLEIEGGTVIWRGDGGEQQFSDVTLAASALSLEGPFEATGSFLHGATSWTISADVGRTSRPQVPINVTLGSDGDHFNLAGSVDFSGAMPAFGGQMQVEGQTLGAVLALTGVEAAGLPQGLRDQPISLDAGVSVSSDAVMLADAALVLGETRAFGEGSLTFGQRPGADIVLDVSRLDLDALLAEAASGGNATVDEMPPFALPRDIDVALDISIDAAIYRGQALRQAHVIAVLEAGTLAISQASGQMPGGTDVALAGVVTNEDGVAVLRGPLEATSDNLRATLAWLGEDLAWVPADRLRRVDVVADLVVQPDVLAMTGIDLRFDSSRLTGSLAARLDGQQAITARIVLDRINLDAYLIPSVQEDTASADGAAFTMPVLPDLDLDLDARVEQLTYNGVAVGGVVAKGVLRDGALAIDSLGAADIAGATVRTSGTVDPGAGLIDLKLGVQAEDAGDLMRLLGITLPIAPSRLGRIELTGEISGGTDQALVRQRLDTGLGQASIDGTLLDVLGSPGFDGRIGLRASSYRALAQALDLTLPEIEDSEIAFAADITTDGDILDSNAVLEVLGLTARSTGNAEGIQGDASYDLRLVAEHGELADLMAAFGTPSQAQLGALKLDLTASGDMERADFTLAPSTLGSSSFRGTMALDLTGERPDAQVRLQAGSLALDPFLALSSGGTLGDVTPDSGEQTNGEAASVGRWSSEPMDLALFDAVDGRLELTAEQAGLQGMTLSGPTIVAILKQGALTIERFDGGLFDGRVSMTGEVIAGVPHRVSLDLALADADARQVLGHFADSDRISGRLFIDATVETAGLSQRDLIQSLAGSGKLSLRDGAVEGFDLGAISDRLGNLDDEAAIVTMLLEASSGGETPILAADGTFSMQDGVATSDDLAVVLEGGKADFTMTADLPRWWIDLGGEARLSAHPAAPTIPITVRGPIDGPTQTLDTSALQSFLAARAAETALRKLGGDSEAAGAAGAVLDLLTGSTPEAPSAGNPPPEATPQEGAPAEDAPDTAAPGTSEPAPVPEQKPAVEGGGSGGGSGSLLDLLTGGTAPAAPEPEQPAQDQQPSQDTGLNGDALLQDLLQSLGN
jgi:uncharacterized protein involved in outer membrane biogenesis